MWAPTAKNKQPVKMWPFKPDEAREKHTGTTPFPLVSKATAVIAVGSRADVAWIRRQDGKSGKSAADDGLPSAYGDFSRFFCILAYIPLDKA